jgi:hypothetical protein
VPQGVAVRIRARAFSALLLPQLWRWFFGGHRVPVALLCSVVCQLEARFSVSVDSAPAGREFSRHRGLSSSDDSFWSSVRSAREEPRRVVGAALVHPTSCATAARFVGRTANRTTPITTDTMTSVKFLWTP